MNMKNNGRGTRTGDTRERLEVVDLIPAGTFPATTRRKRTIW
jgi:hypothetical protein